MKVWHQHENIWHEHPTNAIIAKNTHDWSIDKPLKAYFEKDCNCKINCVKAEVMSGVLEPTG